MTNDGQQSQLPTTQTQGIQPQVQVADSSQTNTDNQQQPPQTQEPSKPRFLSDKISFENRDSLSLPNSQAPTATPNNLNPNQTVEPNQTPIATSSNGNDAEQPETSETQTTEVKPFDALSVDLPTNVPTEPVIGQDNTQLPSPTQPPFVPPEGSPLKSEDPQWQHEAYQRVADDQTLTPDEKKTILATSPHYWDRGKELIKTSRKFGKVRDSEVPVTQVVEMLEKESPTRVEEIFQLGVNKILTEEGVAQKFIANNKETYARLITALASENPQFVSTVLQRQGYTVEKAKPFDKEAAINELKANPEWSLIEDTPLAQKMIDEIEERAKLQPQPVTTDELVKELDDQKQPENQSQMFPPEVRQLAVSTYSDVEERVFLNAVAQGLHAEGMRRPTETEWKINPTEAANMTFAYEAALKGGGGIQDWDTASEAYCGQMDGFLEKMNNLQRMFKEQKFEDFKSMSPSLQPYYYEFGKQRAKIGRARASYDQALKRLKETQTQQSTQTQSLPQQQTNNGQPTQQGFQQQGQQQQAIPLPQSQQQQGQKPIFFSDGAYIEAYKRSKLPSNG